MKYLFKISRNKILMILFIFKILNFRSSLKVLSFVWNKYVLRKKIPGVGILALTYRCQCRCSHCSAGLFKINSDELSFDEWKKVIDAFDALGTPRLHISGGEPTLKEDYYKIINYASSKGMIVFLETNGFTMTQEMLSRIKEANVSSIDISLDSTNPQTHDELRGLNKCFDKAIQSMELCKKNHIPFMVSTYATRKNIYSGELKDLILFAKQIQADAIRILPPQPSGRWLNKFDELLMEKDKTYLRKQYPFFTILDRIDLPYCPITNKYTAFIAPDGEIHPCPHLPFSFGNIRTIDLERALELMSSHEMFAGKSICYINNPEFRTKYIKPLLDREDAFPIKIFK